MMETLGFIIVLVAVLIMGIIALLAVFTNNAITKHYIEKLRQEESNKDENLSKNEELD